MRLELKDRLPQIKQASSIKFQTQLLKCCTVSWGRDNGLVQESAVDTPTPQQSPHPSANKPVLQQKVPKDSQTDHSVARAPSKSLKRATQVQLDHIQRFPSLYGLPAHKYKSPVQPQQPPQQRHAWQAVEQQRPLQPKSYPLSSAGSQPRPQTPPLSRSSSGASSPTNTTAPISAPALSSTPTRLPPTQLSTPPAVASEVMRQDSKSPAPVLQWSGYIPGRIWNTVNEIKACKRHTRSGLPLRSELKLERFRDHFKADGILRPDSELGKHKGDPRLFTPLWWEHLLRWPGMCTDTES